VLIIAHRGASGLAPENTLAAFKLALDMGAKAIELDVHQTRDGQLVVLHDYDLKRTAGVQKAVKDLTYERLVAYDVGGWFHKSFKGQRVPLLSEVYDLCEGKAQLNVELKKGSSVYPGIEQRLVELIEERKAWSSTLVSSFDHPALYNVRALARRARIGYLRGFTRMRTAYREMAALGAESLNCSARQADGRTIRACHDRGLKVLVYTVNEGREIARLDKLGVDGVFCNYPDVKIP
jgi:glycerophosphoryl diester phosphodiesterase